MFKSSRDSFNVEDDINVPSIKTAIHIVVCLPFLETYSSFWKAC